jgi:hypothetical protein
VERSVVHRAAVDYVHDVMLRTKERVVNLVPVRREFHAHELVTRVPFKLLDMLNVALGALPDVSV